MSIKSITLENFKSFDKPEKMDFEDITILTGTNSSGKSSFMKGCMLMGESINNNKYSRQKGLRDNFRNLLLRNSKLKLGQFDNIRHYNKISTKTNFKFSSVYDEPTGRVMLGRGRDSVKNKIYHWSFGYTGDEEGGKLSHINWEYDSLLIYESSLTRGKIKHLFKPLNFLKSCFIEYLPKTENQEKSKKSFRKAYINEFNLVLQEFIEYAKETDLVKDFSFIENNADDKKSDGRLSDEDFESLYFFNAITESKLFDRGNTFNMSWLFEKLLLSKSKTLSNVWAKVFLSYLNEATFNREFQSYLIQESHFKDFLVKDDLHDFPLFIHHFLTQFDFDEQITKGIHKELVDNHNEEINKRARQIDRKSIKLKREKEDLTAELKVLQERLNKIKKQDKQLVNLTGKILSHQNRIFQIDADIEHNELKKAKLSFRSPVDEYQMSMNYTDLYNLNINRTFDESLRGLIMDLGRYNYIGVAERSFQERYFVNNNYSSILYKLLSTGALDKLNSDFVSWDFVTTWFRNFDIGEGFRIKTIENEVYSIQIEKQNNKWINLADLGVGSIQLATMLFAIVYEQNFNSHYKRWEPLTFFIEEPEASLHPSYQSDFIDFIVDCRKRFNTRFIIETHSIYLIRKLQNMVADKSNELDSSNVIIYYFNGGKKEKERKYPIKIEPNGSLSRSFGRGFLDMESELTFERLTIKNLSKK